MSRFILASVIVTLGAAAPPQAPPPQAPDLVRGQARAFESVLKEAINAGGQKLAEWADKQAPGIVLVPAALPVVQSFPLPDDSLMFTVQFGEILPSGLQAMELMELLRAAGPVRPQQNVGRVTGTSLPARAGAVGGDATPNEMYANYIREALIDAMLDSSGVLPLKGAQWLVIAATPVDVLVTNPLYLNQSRKLILSITGENLAKYRQGTITKDEARRLIVERRY